MWSKLDFIKNQEVTQKKIENIISELENSNNKKKAFFGLYQYGGDIHESCIRANRQGLILYAVELLRASKEIEKGTFENGKIEHYKIDLSWTDENADFCFDNLELTSKIKTKKVNTFPKYQETWKDKLYSYLFLGIIMVLVIFLIIGFTTTVKWLF